MKLQPTDDGKQLFWCPGCEEPHFFVPGMWTWDGELERPTVSPSILVTGFNAKSVERRCHLYLVAGRLQFLGDCSHALAGKTVELPDWDHEREVGE